MGFPVTKVSTVPPSAKIKPIMAQKSSAKITKISLCLLSCKNLNKGNFSVLSSLISLKATRSELPSMIMPKSKIAIRIKGLLTSWAGWTSLSYASITPITPPPKKRKVATNMLKKYFARASPKGCTWLCALLARLSPKSSKTWFPQSTKLCILSLSIAALPLKA